MYRVTEITFVRPLRSDFGGRSMYESLLQSGILASALVIVQTVDSSCRMGLGVVQRRFGVRRAIWLCGIRELGGRHDALLNIVFGGCEGKCMLLHGDGPIWLAVGNSKNKNTSKF